MGTFIPLSVGVAMLCTTMAAADWPMLGRDVSRSGGTADEIRPPFVRRWYRLFPEEGIQTGVQPVVSERTLYLGTLKGVLHAMDTASGTDRWTYQAGSPILHSAGIGSGKVYFGAADGTVHAVNTRDGTRSWVSPTGAAVWNAPAVFDKVVFIGSRDGHFYAFDAVSGKTNWSADVGAPVLNSPAVDSKRGRVYVGSEAMRVHAFSLGDGEELWRTAPLPGSSMRGYHPVIAPDGSVLVTTAPVIGYDRFQELLLEMVRAVFGDFASWRHKKEENDKLRAENFKLMERPETYRSQLDYLRKRLEAEPQFQTFFVLDPATGQQRFVAPVVASESMNGPGAPPLVTPEGKVIVKYQVLLRSRYEHYSPLLNVGYLDTRTGDIEPIMDQSRTYGWHDSLLLVHDEQCQLSLAGSLLLNTHQDNVNALDLRTLKGFPQPFALNIHEPAPGEALALRIAALNDQQLTPGNEWLIRGTAIYGGGSVLDVPVVIAHGAIYYLPTHELNSGCALVAYQMAPSAAAPKRSTLPKPRLSADILHRVQEMPWDWDTLMTPRLTNFLAALPGPIPGTASAPLREEARGKVEAIEDGELDDLIWSPAFDPAISTVNLPANARLASELQRSTWELINAEWRPFVTPAAKAPEHAYRFFSDPAGTLYTLALARPFLPEESRNSVDAFASWLLQKRWRQPYPQGEGQPRESYRVPSGMMQVVNDPLLDDLARCYPLWLWSRTPRGSSLVKERWPELRPALHTPPQKAEHDCGNSRLSGLIAYCRLARDAGDQKELEEALILTRKAIRERLLYEFAHTRGGLIGGLPDGRSAFVRWRHLSPEVGRLLAKHVSPVQQKLMQHYVDHLRPAWWLAWNAEQLMRNEAPYQLPTTPLEIFAARALVLGASTIDLERHIDLPWCRADEFYIQKLALALLASRK